MSTLGTAVPPAAREQAPYRARDPKEVRQLLQSLQSHQTKGRKKEKGGFTCKQTSFPIAQLGGREVSSWKMSEWDYKRDDLPTYARGLFTYVRTDGVPEIAVRGYDKFFNIDEVNDTKWRNIENSTCGPYELSNKENGCIIFVTGLEDDVILVCSKHSTGERGDASASHAVQGERWLEKHLASVGRTTKDLARELRKRNVTLVAELCDDSFEEHVLEYGPEVSGLYVHGMNLNVPDFATYPFHLVQQFADEWGLRKAKYVVKDSLTDAKDFLEKCGETGSWNGRDTEGFVIRCQKGLGKGIWVDWFFKYKYDEPYLMYRQWRECTKALIAGKTPKNNRKHQKITEAYLQYVRQRLAKDPQLGKLYNQNHGIIAMREGFLKQLGKNGSEIIRAEEESDEPGAGSNKSVAKNMVLVPVSTIGCGKTTIANALVKLFGWGHVQNDNIQARKGKGREFAIQLTNLLASHPVVIADRNNHQKRERKQIFDDISKIVPSARYVALQYVHDPKDKMVPLVKQVTLERVTARGDNHQTIQASSKGTAEVEEIMDGFLHRFEPVDDSAEPDNQFDEIINMDPRDDSRQNLDIVVNALHQSFPKLVPNLPSPDELDEAIDLAMNEYSVTLRHEVGFGKKNNRATANKVGKSLPIGKANGASKPKEARIEYFAVRVPPQQILDCLKETFAGADSALAAFYHKLKQMRRVQTKFHVTLIHMASKNQRPELWNKLEERHRKALASGDSMKELDPLLGHCTVKLDKVVWDERIMCIAAQFTDPQWESANTTPHITIGTAGDSVKPKESNDLLARWLQEGTTNSGINELPVRGAAMIDGEVRAVTPATR